PPRSTLVPYTTLFRSYTGQPNVQGASGVPAASSTIFTNAIWVYGWKYGESESGVITVRDEEEVAKNGVRELVIPASDWRSWQGGDRKSTRLNSSHVKS